ncbi:MAG: NAD-dependent epimerase [Pseudomonadota bacterium]
MTVLVTGAAGFIGFHLIQRLLADDIEVVGVDNLTPYYDVALKQARLDQLGDTDGFHFQHLDIADREGCARLFQKQRFSHVINLAAQPGVRYSLEHPASYIDTNLVGFANILEGCRHGKVDHLVYASSSSVYGMNQKVPFSTADNVDYPVSLYAASKKANELMAHSYSHLYDIPVTGLRFFTVYGPWGRPDMAYFSFAKAILNGDPIPVFNRGEMQRDFTYIDDIVEGVVRVMAKIPQEQSIPGTNATSRYQLYNIGNNQPETLRDFIAAIEQACGREAVLDLLPMQPGDVPITYADIDSLVEDTGFSPNTPLQDGINRFVGWYRDYYQV